MGLIIGPKGIYQKRLEEQTGCRVLIRGKGSHKDGHPLATDDTDEQHVLIIGDSSQQLAAARNLIYKVLTADEETRNAIRSEQLKAANEMSRDFYMRPVLDDHLLTPYGPPSPFAQIFPVPNECVGLIIGKGGDTIRHLQLRSGCKIQVAKKQIPYTDIRNVFVEGPQDKLENARVLIEKIVHEHKRVQESLLKVGLGEHNPFEGPYKNVPIQDLYIDAIIGVNGH